MPVTLSSAEIEKLARAMQLLLSPLAHPSVDAWRSAVNHELKELLHADSAGFFLPLEHGPALYSEEHDPAELARYTDYLPPPLPDGRSIYELIVHTPVSPISQVYGRDYDIYLKSPYYNEYAGKNGAHDTLFMCAPVVARETPIPLALMHLWHGRPDGRRFGEREFSLLRLLHPAFRAGVEMQLHLGGQRGRLVDSLDALGVAAALYDQAGERLHKTPALSAILATDPEADRLRAELVAVVGRALAILRGGGTCATTLPTGPVVSEVRTATATYLARAALHRDPTAGPDDMVLGVLERLTPMPRSDDELRAAYDLTRAELRVARLLARGRSNADIAATLHISPHTARHHTERILFKLDASSRAEVGPKLFQK